MWEKIRKLTDIALITGFLGFIYLVLVMTYTGPVQKAIESTKFTFGSYEDLSNKFEEVLQKNLYKKYGFINLNGKIIRMLRINSLNRTQKLANGFLAGFFKATDVNTSAANIIELNNFLLERHIPFLYILVPYKDSFYDVKFALGYGSDLNQNSINMINALNIGGVSNIDMDDWFEKNEWHMEDVFWRTDQHWKPEAGLAAARCTMELLQKQGIAEYDKDKLQDKNYKIKILKNWFLGAYGKRVGKYYSGVDDIAIYQPKFKTNYFYTGLRRNTTNWEYRNNILDMSYAGRKDYFEKNPYCIYMYADYPLRITINTKAQNKKKLLIMGDSFKIMLEYFLTTQYKEIHTMDLRYYTDGTFAQYIEEIKPDTVIMCTNTVDVSSEKLYNFGVKEYIDVLEKSVSYIQEIGDIEMQAEENNNNKFRIVCRNLEPNQTYTLTVDSTKLSGVKNSFVQMTLQNMLENKAVYNRYFNANSGKTQKWIFTTPKKVEDTYGIYLYAGVKGHTAKIGVTVDGIRLRKGIFEQ